MKPFILLIIVLTTFFLSPMEAQDKNQYRYIEVTGTAELEVIPNEIYLSVQLNEADWKNRRSLEQLEQDMVNAIRKLGIPTENLSISDANSKLEKEFWSGKQIYGRKDYVLKLTEADKIGQVMRELEQKKIANVNLLKVDHSDMDKFKKEVKILAMKNAKEKADYLLEAIGEKTAKPIYIQERNYSPPTYRSNMYMAKSVDAAEYKKDYTIEFQEMKLTYEIVARFEIEE